MASMRYRPAVYVRRGRYHSRLNMVGFGADSIAEIATAFDTPEEALTDLMARLRLVYQFGDRVEVRGAVYRDVGAVEAALRESLPLSD